MSRNGIWINDKDFVEFKDTKTSLSAEIATRERSIDFYSLGMYLPNPDPVLKKIGKDIAVYKDLLADGHLGGCVTSRKAGVKSLNWEIDRGKSKSKQAKIITDLFNNLDMDNIISQILDAPLYGYSVMEVVWEHVGDYWLPARIVGKPQDWFYFHADDNALLFRTKSNWQGERVPEKRFLVAEHEATYANPYGFATLSRCFWPVTFKKGGFRFWVTFTEKYGMPYIWGKLPRGLDQKEYDSLAELLEAMVQDAIAVTPDDASIELKTADVKGSSDVFSGLIQECKTEISIATLGQNLTTEVQGGSFAASESHMTVRGDIIDSDKKIVERVLNELIKWIYEFNFTGGERPVFAMYAEEDVDSTLATRDKTLSDTGQVKFTKKYFMTNYGFEEDDIEVVDPPPRQQFGAMPAMAQFAENIKNVGAGLVPALAPARDAFADQQAIVAAIDSIDPADLQAQMEGLLKPVIDMVNSGEDYSDMMEKLIDAYPKMETKAIEEMLARAIFVSEVWGRLNGKR